MAHSSRVSGFKSDKILWHELKEYIPRKVKPKTKDKLVDGMHAFWDTVYIPKCVKCIRHLMKVIECNGAATGY